jgi:hypothetical protein
MESPASTISRTRQILVWVLVVLTTLITFGSAAEVWIKHQLLDTPAWVRASDELLATPVVRAALAEYIVDEVYSTVDVQEQLSDKLPEEWKGISGPISAAIRGPVTSTVENLLGAPKIAAVWNRINTTAHQTLVNVLEDKTKFGTTSDGKVVLDLGEVIRAVATNLGLSQSAVDRIPADAGKITLIESSQLASVQQAVRVLSILNWVLLIVVVGLYGLAVFLARGRRRITLRNVGWSLLLVAFALVIVRDVTGKMVVDLIKDPNLTAVGRVVYLVGSELLVTVALTIATYGAVIVFGTVIVGPNRVATWLRRAIAPLLNADTTVFWIGAAVLFVLVWLWEPTAAFGIWWSVLGLLIVGALGLEFLRRRSFVEFPDARLDVDLDGVKRSVSGTWSSVAGRVRSFGEGSGSGAADPLDRLAKLQTLHASGALTDEEFSSAKATVLADLGS